MPFALTFYNPSCMFDAKCAVYYILYVCVYNILVDF